MGAREHNPITDPKWKLYQCRENNCLSLSELEFFDDEVGRWCTLPG